MQIDDTLQQIIKLINSGGINSLLITSGKNDDPDAVGSMLALAEALKPKIKNITLAIEEFDPRKYPFLPGAEHILSNVGQKSLIVSIDMSQNPLEKINYNSQDSRFNLILTPKIGQVDVDQIEYSYTGVNFDAIIAVDTAKKELLGQWAADFDQELQDIPLINLDHHQDNGLYGTLNYIRSDYASATLVVFELLQALKTEITPPIATTLLIGLLSDTSGFANSNTDAASLRQAASLIDQGADIHQAMVALFRTLSFPAIRLWGIVLSRVTNEPPGVIYAYLTPEDITQAEATEADVATLGSVMNNILVADQSAQLAIMLKDKGEGQVTGSFRAIADIDVAAIAHQLGGGGHIKAAGFRLTETTIPEAKEKVLSAIRKSLKSSDDSQPQSSQSIEKNASSEGDQADE